MPARVHTLDGAPTARRCCCEHLVPIFTDLPSKLPGATLMWRKKLKAERKATHLRTLLGGGLRVSSPKCILGQLPRGTTEAQSRWRADVGRT